MDVASGHRREIGQFAEALKRDGVDFRAACCQDVISDLSLRLRDEHTAYIDYLADRYL